MYACFCLHCMFTFEFLVLCCCMLDVHGFVVWKVTLFWNFGVFTINY